MTKSHASCKSSLHFVRSLKVILSLSLLLSIGSLYSQTSQNDKSSDSSQLPAGYRNIMLGTTVEQTKTELEKDPVFGYKGDRDVSLLPTQERILIETSGGSTFLDRCYFQFYEDKLYLITININQDRIDYYSLFTTLCKKYGEPIALSPEKCSWQNDSVILSLEKPRTLKYIDRKVFEQLQEESTIQKSATEYTKEMFLDEL